MAAIVRPNYTTTGIVSLIIILFENVFCQPYEGKCEPVTVKFCKDLPYNETILPNTLGDKDQNDISLTLETQYLALINKGCSDQFASLLCFIYVPVCTTLNKPIPPCRRICTHAKSGCERIMNEFGYNWPDVLNCEQFPASGLCVGENYTSNSDTTTSKSSGFSVVPKWSKLKPTNPVTVINRHDNLPVFLIISTWNSILLFDVPTNDVIILDSGFDQGATLDFHYKNQWIFWAYNSDGRINRGTLTLDALKNNQMLIDVGPATVTSIAVDWLTQKLFWLESYPSRIRVSDLDGRNPTNILSEELKEAKSMVIDPFEGCLFWLDRVGDLYSPSAAIEKYDLRTKRHQIILNITQELIPDMGRPIGMTTDLKNKRLYWVDARSESIQSIDYHGKNFQLIIRGGHYLTEPNSIAIFGQYAFWSDRATQSVVKTSKETGGSIDVLKSLTASPPFEVKVFHRNAQPSGRATYNVSLVPSNSANNICNLTGIFVLALLFMINI